MADDTIFSKTHVKRVLKEAGADRVSSDAIVEMEKALVEYGKTVGKKALELANMAKRKTIQVDDIKKAKKA